MSREWQLFSSWISHCWIGKEKSVCPFWCWERKTHTILSCVSATGFIVPPMMIYPCKICVPGSNTLFKSSESGWITSELFVDWCEFFFLKSIPPIHPVLLVQDGNSSHVNWLRWLVTTECACYVCQLTHLTFFNLWSSRVFKSSFNKAYSNYMKQNLGKVITTDILASMVGQAFPNAFTFLNINFEWV